MKRPLDGPRPRFVAPPGSCDTHMHIYADAYPHHPRGPAAAPEATVADYRRVMARLGLDRVVVVQPNAYGDDNRCTMDAVAALGTDVARAIVVVEPDIAETELERLARAGARGVRIMCLPGGYLGWEALPAIANRIKSFGWHVIVQFDGRQTADYIDRLSAIQIPFVIDHTGKFLEPVSTDATSFTALLRLLDRGNCYIKLSAAYETSKDGAPDYEDVGALATAIARHAPERLLWASNWPHPSATAATYPDDAGLLDLFAAWVPDAAARHAALVDNPARLYGFGR